jgi:hypothetical protein
VGLRSRIPEPIILKQSLEATSPVVASSPASSPVVASRDFCRTRVIHSRCVCLISARPIRAATSGGRMGTRGTYVLRRVWRRRCRVHSLDYIPTAPRFKDSRKQVRWPVDQGSISDTYTRPPQPRQSTGSRIGGAHSENREISSLGEVRTGGVASVRARALPCTGLRP